MIARAFVAQRAVDHDEIGRRSGRNDLPGRGEADQDAAAAGEQLFRDKHRKGRADRAADDARRSPAEWKFVQLAVIAGPGVGELRLAAALEAAHDIAVRIEDADVRHAGGRQALLPPRLAQQGDRLEYRGCIRVFVGENGRDGHC